MKDVQLLFSHLTDDETEAQAKANFTQLVSDTGICLSNTALKCIP